MPVTTLRQETSSILPSLGIKLLNRLLVLLTGTIENLRHYHLRVRLCTALAYREFSY